jgi:hypothetical protein
MGKEKIVSYTISTIFLILLLIYTYPLIGLWDQSKTTSYPDSYKEAESYLKERNITGHIIYLPWETYLTYNWSLNTSSDGRIANPINRIIKPIIITGPDEYSGKDQLQESIGNCLEIKSIDCLKNNAVQYVLKDRCAIYGGRYAFLNNPQYRNSCIDIYEINDSKSAEKPSIPIGFILGTSISLITLVFIIFHLMRR